MAELERKGVSERMLSAEDLAALQKLRLEWNDAAASAQTITPYPILNARFLPDILNTLLGGGIGWSDAQKRKLDQELQAILRADPLPADATPLQVYAHRHRLLAVATAKDGHALHRGAAQGVGALGAAVDRRRAG